MLLWQTTGFSTLNGKDIHLANDSGGQRFKQQGTNLARPPDCVVVREKWMGTRHIKKRETKFFMTAHSHNNQPSPKE